MRLMLRRFALLAAMLLVFVLTAAVEAQAGPVCGKSPKHPCPTASPPDLSTATSHHFVSNQGSLLARQQAALGVGYDWQDFSSNSVMNASPAGVQGIRWVGNGYNSSCSWAVSDASLMTIVQANIGNPEFSGVYFISDEPHTSLCPDAPAALAARTALIHRLDPAARTFAVVSNGSSHPGEYEAFKDSVDYIGVNPYPCKVNNAQSGCDLTAMAAKIDSALAWIPPSRVIPVFQLFGQSCNAGSSHYYRLPSETELQSMLSLWDSKVPRSVRPFDNSYGWRTQSSACPTLVDANGTNGYPDLQSVMHRYFAG